MIINPNELLNTSDKIVEKPFKYGFIGAVSAAILILLDYSTFVNMKEFGSYFLPIIYIVFAFSSALIIWGIFFYTYAWLAEVSKARAEKKRKSTKYKLVSQMLLENLDRLSDGSKRLMCEYVVKPSGRFLSPELTDEYPEFHALLDANLINIENRETATYTPRRALTPGTHCRVNYALYAHLKETDPDFDRFKAKYHS